MGVEYDQAFCMECNKRVRAERKATNHILHLILSIVSFGLWIPVWSLASIKIGGWRCPHCGSSKLKRKVLGFGAVPENPGFEQTTSATNSPSDMPPVQPTQVQVARQAKQGGGIFGVLKFVSISFVIAIAALAGMTALMTGSPPSSSPSSLQEPRASLAKSEPTQERRDYAKVSCKEFSRMFGLQSNLSDLQKEEAFKGYKDKWVKWTGEVAEVSTTFGSPNVQIKCLSETLVSDAIVSFPRSAKDSLLSLSKGTTVTFEARIEGWGALTSHRLGDAKLIN